MLVLSMLTMWSVTHSILSSYSERGMGGWMEEEGRASEMTGWTRGRSKDAAAKSLQSCPTLCDPIDGSPPGSAVPGILQARTLEWVAISFSNA